MHVTSITTRARNRADARALAYLRLRAAQSLMANAAAEEIAAGIDYETPEYDARNQAVIDAEADCTRLQVLRARLIAAREWDRTTHGVVTPADRDNDNTGPVAS